MRRDHRTSCETAARRRARRLVAWGGFQEDARVHQRQRRKPSQPTGRTDAAAEKALFRDVNRIIDSIPHAEEFGIGAACGLNPFVSGLPAERLHDVLAYHRTIADLL